MGEEGTLKVGGWPVASLADARGNVGVMDHGIKPVISSMRVWGPAATVRVIAGDAYAVTAALAHVSPGDVLVVDARGVRDIANVGANISLALKMRGAAGAVVDGSVRDVSDIEELDFPVFARGTHPCVLKGFSDGGTANVPVTCGGVTVRPGDYVAGDRDGVIVIPQDEVAAAGAAVDVALTQEAEWQRQLRSGVDALVVWGLTASDA